MQTSNDRIDFMKSSGLASPRNAARGLVGFLVLAFALLLSLNSALAQSGAGADDPLVSKLYGDAKAAEAHGDFAGAAASYEALLQVAPRLAPAYNNLGSLYLRQREYKKAAAVLEKGLKIDPKMSSASALLGVEIGRASCRKECRSGGSPCHEKRDMDSRRRGEEASMSVRRGGGWR